ncbi:hypothetical protein Tco_1278293 [Tanacetum coccineum]
MPLKSLINSDLKRKGLKNTKDEEIRELKAQLQKKKEEAKVQFSKKEFPPLGNTHVARPCVETEVHYSGNATASPKIRKITNQLYNVKVEFDIPNCAAFGTIAIIDTGASACCINKKEEAEVQFSREEFPPLGSTHVARPCVETEVHYSGNATASTQFPINFIMLKLSLIFLTARLLKPLQ